MGNIEMNVPASEEIRQRFEKYNYFFCVDNRGLTIEQDTQVRKIACEMGGEFCVYNNSAIKSSIEGMSFAGAVSEILEGPTAVAFFSDYDSALGFYECAQVISDVPEWKAFVLPGEYFVGTDRVSAWYGTITEQYRVEAEARRAAAEQAFLEEHPDIMAHYDLCCVLYAIIGKKSAELETEASTCYENGRYDEAVKNCELAIQFGSKYAHLLLGAIYNDERYSGANAKLAYYHTRKAAPYYLEAKFGLGLYLLNGIGTAKRPSEGFKTLCEAMENGHARAAVYAGIAKELGTGTKQDYSKMAEYFWFAVRRDPELEAEIASKTERNWRAYYTPGDATPQERAKIAEAKEAETPFLRGKCDELFDKIKSLHNEAVAAEKDSKKLFTSKTKKAYLMSVKAEKEEEIEVLEEELRRFKGYLF